MSDPFGALATQRRADMGVFDGVQWQPSNRGKPYSVAGVVGGTYMITEGDPTTPVTNNGVTVYISRDMKNSAGADINAALWVTNHNNGATQPVAVTANAYQDGSGDTCGIYGRGVNSGTGNAFGIFTVAQSNPGSVGFYGNNSTVANNTGASFVYAATGAPSAAYAAQALLDNAHTSGTAFLVLQTSDGATGWFKFHTGLGFQEDTVTGTTIQDDTTSDISYDIINDHATAGIRITQNNAAHYAQRWRRTSATAAEWGLLVHSNGELHLDQPGVAQKLVVVPGTPGANKTALYIQEGAGPTMRQFTTFDPGAAGVNFTAGQLVAVLV